jgi:hypothetical protein
LYLLQFVPVPASQAELELPSEAALSGDADQDRFHGRFLQHQAGNQSDQAGF